MSNTTRTPREIARQLRKRSRVISDDMSPDIVGGRTNNFLYSAFSEMLEPATDNSDALRDMSQYQFDVAGYCRDVHDIELWSGIDGADGQLQIAQHYELALRQQHERNSYEQTGQWNPDIWTPNETIKTWIRVEAGHTVGKTLLAAMLVNHFFDTFESVTYAFAPTYDQINDLLFKEIRKARDNRDDLKGTVLRTPAVNHSGNHFIKGKASSGGATERVHGQHEPYMLFVLDEAEGIEDYVWEAIESMAGGGIYVVICLANPRTDSSMFARYKEYSYVQNFRLSCIDHPNVHFGREIVKGAVRRDYVDTMVEKHCAIVKEHNPDYNTFELHWRQGNIYMPNSEFLFRVLGIAPADKSKNTFCPPARVEAAMRRDAEELDAEWTSEMYTEFASIGVDCARYGDDSGKVYTFHKGEAKLFWSIYKQNTHDYFGKVVEAIDELYANGARVISIRVDGGGGYGSGVIDMLNSGDMEFPDDLEVMVHEVQFQEQAEDTTQYGNLITQLYESVAGMLSYIRITEAPDALVADLSARTYKYTTRRGRPLKVLTDKEAFRKQRNRSPDDGDGFVLAVADENLFSGSLNVGFA